MAELTPIPFPELLRRMRREVEVSRSIFDLPASKWFTPTADFDFSATHFGRSASTPVGPAAGPHTQLAQNIVLSWLAGGRILELKTVQVNDRLEIPRPCIHVPNVGYNVEWSQELRVEESLVEYAKAVYLIEILKDTRVFGVYDDNPAFDASTDTVYDISVGYDLDGIRSEKVTGYLRAMRNPGSHFDALRGLMDGDLAAFRDVPLPPTISECVTLSTFHGCPADQIELIAKYLLQDIGLHTIIKINPTLLGFNTVRDLVVDRLGYDDIELRREAFEQDLKYDDGLEILRRLRTVAEDQGSSIGAKFTNTLVVANKPEFFQTQSDPYMYVSGPPLHVISMTLMQRFREDLGFEFPVSFSAGIDKLNFPSAVACGMVPVTTCTDLLRQGGYGRLPRYLMALGKKMRAKGATSREAYVIAATDHGAQAIEEAVLSQSEGRRLWDRNGTQLTTVARDEPDQLPTALRALAAEENLDGDALVLLATRIAGRLNGRDIVPPLADDRRYHAESNRKEPRRIESTLALYDCINCDLCISACPNDAIFAYDATPTTAATEVVGLGVGNELRLTAGTEFVIGESHQLAVVEGACNECSNCEVYCPEHGAPFLVKERVYISMTDFRRDVSGDGFCRQDDLLYGRIDGNEITFRPEPHLNRGTAEFNGVRLDLTWDPLEVKACHGDAMDMIEMDTRVLWRMKTVWESIFNSRRPNTVNPEPALAGDAT
ncbi:MAG: 4Fe-4S binding protein [Rhodothermales bacterium]|nr:4Fe-4S binding protein [Rhodothermales bacterium]